MVFAKGKYKFVQIIGKFWSCCRWEVNYSEKHKIKKLLLFRPKLLNLESIY